MAVHGGVNNLFKAGKHDLVVPLVNALGKRTFKSKRLKYVAIQWAFWKELKEAIKTLWKNIVNIPQSPLRNMPMDCIDLGTDGKPNQVFPFLLKQADQGDLDKAKKRYADEYYADSVKPLTKPSRLPHLLDQDIFVHLKGPNLSK